MLRLTCSLLATLLCSTVALADAPVAQPLATRQPVKVTAAAARSAVFQGKTAVKSTGADGPVTDVLLLRSRDGRYEAGLYDAGPSEQDIAAYPEDEFMFFLDGGVKLTSSDGTVLEAVAGEGVVVPKGWKGHWSTQGYKKYYVTYDSGAKAK